MGSRIEKMGVGSVHASDTTQDMSGTAINTGFCQVLCAFVLRCRSEQTYLLPYPSIRSRSGLIPIPSDALSQGEVLSKLRAE